MEIKLIDNKSDELIVFLTGWGCDDNQFRFMKGKRDILLCYNYTNLDFEFSFDNYKKCYLIAFSAGVFIAGALKNKLPNFEKTIAVNGNPLAYDKYFGLRKEIVDIFNGVTKENAQDFRRKYLVYDDKEFRLFNKYLSCRSFESCKEELVSLAKCTWAKTEPFSFDAAIISLNDKIFYPQRQFEYWKDKSRVIKLENSAHFPFLKLGDYDEIINF